MSGGAYAAMFLHMRPKRLQCLRLRDELGVEVGAEPFDAAFAAVAGFLHPTERRFRRRDGNRVDAHHPGRDRVADRGRGRVRTGERIGRQPKGSAFARSTTSSKVLKVTIGAIGPNGSWVITLESSGTSVTIVGS